MTELKSKPIRLGCIRRQIAGIQHHPVALNTGDGLHLIREPENAYDANAIRLETDDCVMAGYLPRRDAEWLAPLIDANRIHLAGEAVKMQAHGRERLYCELAVDLFDEAIVHPPTPQNSREANHAAVAQTYAQLDAYENPQLIDQLRERFRAIIPDPLPETRLLLALFFDKAEQARRRSGDGARAGLENTLSGLTLGEAISSNGFSVIPLMREAASSSNILLLKQAMDEKRIRVKEVSASGDVQTISVENLSHEPVLIPEGDIVIGAKQNRVINLTVLISGNSKLNVPVSCVEQGRWSDGSKIYFSAATKAPPKLRAKNMQFVKESRESRRDHSGNQGAVWAEVDNYLHAARVESPTDSLTDSFEKERERLKEHHDALKCPSGASGFMFLHDGAVLGLDLYCRPDMLERAWPELIDSYLIEAVRTAPAKGAVASEEPQAMLERLRSQLQPVDTRLGLGSRFELEDKAYQGSALAYNNELCHLSVMAN